MTFFLYLIHDSIHESESLETLDIESSQGASVAENTTETEAENAVQLTPARCNRLKKADEDILLKKAISCTEKATSIPPSKEKGTLDADKIFVKFLESELRSIHDPQWKEWCKWQMQSILHQAHMGELSSTQNLIPTPTPNPNTPF